MPEATIARRRAPWFTASVGVAVGMLLSGLVLPFALGERGADVVSSAGEPLATATSGDGAAAAAPTEAAPVGAGAVAVTAPATPQSGQGPSATGEPEGTEPATGPSQTKATRSASDVGVTADRVKVGFLLLDIGGLGQVGIDVGISVEQQQAAVQAFVDEVNERGGVHGRRIQPIYRPVNLLDQDAGRVACAELTQDHKVFVTTGHLPRPEDVQCFTVQHRSPLVTTNIHGDEAYRRSGGRLVTLQMRGGRLMQNWIHELDRLKYLGDRKIGIVTDEGFDQGGVTATQLRHMLEAAGHEVARVSRLARDYQTGSGQVPVEVNQMRAAGVGAVFMLANSIFAQQFAQQADGQGWRPRYTTSPWAAMDTDTANENMPPSFDGTIGMASIQPDTGGWPEPPRAAACRMTYNRRSGRTLAASNTNEYGVTMLFCDAVHVVVAGLQQAGVNPTRGSLATGFLKVGRLEGLAWAPGGTFGPGKPDLLDHLRPQRWTASCKCYRPAGPYRRTRF